MRIHHLNAASMCPVGMRLMYHGDHDHMVCHCLLVEHDSGLILIDTGLGLHDVRQPRQRLGGMFTTVVRPRCEERECAVRQIEALGFAASDVRHIVATHLDLDHAGGLPDFPRATVHVLEAEQRAALARATWSEAHRYRPGHFAHDISWAVYEPDGESWHGFSAVRQLDGLPPELLLIPLIGHSRGHSGVAIDTGAGWLLHAGDAYFHHDSVHEPSRGAPWMIRAFARMLEHDRAQRLHNRARLRQLAAQHGDRVTVFCAHDPAEYAALAG